MTVTEECDCYALCRCELCLGFVLWPQRHSHRSLCLCGNSDVMQYRNKISSNAVFSHLVVTVQEKKRERSPTSPDEVGEQKKKKKDKSADGADVVKSEKKKKSDKTVEGGESEKKKKKKKVKADDES